MTSRLSHKTLSTSGRKVNQLNVLLDALQIQKRCCHKSWRHTFRESRRSNRPLSTSCQSHRRSEFNATHTFIGALCFENRAHCKVQSLLNRVSAIVANVRLLYVCLNQSATGSAGEGSLLSIDVATFLRSSLPPVLAGSKCGDELC